MLHKTEKVCKDNTFWKQTCNELKFSLLIFKGFNSTDDDPENDHMNVFAVYQHSHLLGRKMR